MEYLVTLESVYITSRNLCQVKSLKSIFLLEIAGFVGYTGENNEMLLPRVLRDAFNLKPSFPLEQFYTSTWAILFNEPPTPEAWIGTR